MGFNSYIFILLFLPITVIGYYLLNHAKKYQTAMCFLTGMSLWFYGYFNSKYLLLLIISMGINYLLTMGLFRADKKAIRKTLFLGGMAFNIGLLLYLKYYNFFIENINAAFGSDFLLHQLWLPLGISFFTFQQIAYVFDCYQRKIPKDSFLNYAAYLTFFPKLTQGPITLPEDLIPQFKDNSKKKINYDNLMKGMYSFSLGLAKKVLLADTIAKFANAGFSDLAGLDSTNAIIAMLCYSLQIYFDFSGYCDMANGIAYLFNIELPINFNSPYQSVSIAQFWERWHITLTKFFTRYLYIPLGGNRKGKLRTYINTLIVFLVSGFWHGANWTFLLWGAINGIFVVIDKAGKKIEDKIPRILRIAVTFAITTFLWTIFRSDTVTAAFSMIGKAFTGQFGAISPIYTDIMNELIEIRILCRFGLQGVVDAMTTLPFLLFMTATLFGVWFMKNTQEKVRAWIPSYHKLAAMVILLTWSIVSLSEISEFIYISF